MYFSLKMDHLQHLTNEISGNNYRLFLWNYNKLEELSLMREYYLGLAKMSNKNYKFGLISKGEHDYYWILVRKITKQIKAIEAYLPYVPSDYVR